jgi:hypothetical protein
MKQEVIAGYPLTTSPLFKFDDSPGDDNVIASFKGLE